MNHLLRELAPIPDAAWAEDYAVGVYETATSLDPFEGAYPPDDTGSDGPSAAKALVRMAVSPGYTHTFSAGDAFRALGQLPGMMGTNWYESFFYPDNDGRVRFTTGDRIAGGHEVMADEINAEKQIVWFRNSWGPGWGANGRFYMTFDLITRLLSEGGDWTFVLPLNVPAPVPTPTDDDRVLRDAQQEWARTKGWST